MWILWFSNSGLDRFRDSLLVSPAVSCGQQAGGQEKFFLQILILSISQSGSAMYSLKKLCMLPPLFLITKL